MVFTTWTYVALAAAVWILLRLIQACFRLPRQLKRQTDMRQVLQDKIESYEKYVTECEQREIEEQKSRGEDATIESTQAEQWKERRECLMMLKKELSKVRENKDSNDLLDYLQEYEEKDQEVKFDDIAEVKECRGHYNDPANQKMKSGLKKIK
ncbi:uncharacterized protein LOC143174560 isoform X2 [Nomia melanderi]